MAWYQFQTLHAQMRERALFYDIDHISSRASLEDVLQLLTLVCLEHIFQLN